MSSPDTQYFDPLYVLALCSAAQSLSSNHWRRHMIATLRKDVELIALGHAGDWRPAFMARDARRLHLEMGEEKG